MKPHNWHRVSSEEQKADPKRYPGRMEFYNDTDEYYAIFWASCRGCGATIKAANDKPSDRWYEDWAMDEDCDMQVVRDVMDS